MGALKEYANREEYKPLTQVARDVLHITTEHPSLHVVFRNGHPLTQPQALETMQKRLEELGIDKVAYVGRGRSALVVKFNDNEIGRITSSREPKRPKLPEYLQPTYMTETADLRLEVLPRVNTHDITESHVRELEMSLIQKGYYPKDRSKNNAGLLEDGTPVYTDGDVADRMPDLLRPFMQLWQRLRYGDSLRHYHFKDSQAGHRKFLGLEQDRLGIQPSDSAQEPAQAAAVVRWTEREIQPAMKAQASR